VIAWSQIAIKTISIGKAFYTDGDVSDRHNRQFTFFKLTNSLAAKLQELFIQYAGHILKAASDFF